MVADLINQADSKRPDDKLHGCFESSDLNR